MPFCLHCSTWRMQCRLRKTQYQYPPTIAVRAKPRAGPLETLNAGRAVYSELKNLAVWNKSNGGMGSFYRSKHELVFIWKNGSAPHINNFELGQHGRNRTNVWDYAGVNTMRAG
jgi:hypothetical protein